MPTPGDHRQVLAALTGLLSADDADPGRAVLRAVRAVVRCEVAALSDVDTGSGRFTFLSEPEPFPVPEDVRDVLAELAAEHPLVRHVQRTGDGSARRISDVATEDEFRSSELYRRVYAPMGIAYQMAITLELPLPAVVAITVSRGSHDFTDRERDSLELLRPHLSSRWRAAQQLARVAAALALVTEPAGTTRTIVLAAPVREAEPGTLDELYRFFGRPSARTSLPPRVERWLAARAAALVAAAGPIPDSPRLLVGTSGRRHAVLQVRAGDGTPDLLRMETDVDGAPDLREQGLTRREAQVLTLLATGASNAVIAAEMHLSAGTVKKHLDHVYAKLGVRGRVQAAAVAHRSGTA